MNKTFDRLIVSVVRIKLLEALFLKELNCSSVSVGCNPVKLLVDSVLLKLFQGARPHSTSLVIRLNAEQK
jgi:hypothetical protein